MHWRTGRGSWRKKNYYLKTLVHIGTNFHEEIDKSYCVFNQLWILSKVYYFYEYHYYIFITICYYYINNSAQIIWNFSRFIWTKNINAINFTVTCWCSRCIKLQCVVEAQDIVAIGWVVSEIKLHGPWFVLRRKKKSIKIYICHNCSRK